VADKKEIHSPANPEIEQQNLPEFEQSTEHPEQDETQIHSEKLRYENADRIY